MQKIDEENTPNESSSYWKKLGISHSLLDTGLVLLPFMRWFCLDLNSKFRKNQIHRFSFNLLQVLFNNNGIYGHWWPVDVLHYNERDRIHRHHKLRNWLFQQLDSQFNEEGGTRFIPTTVKIQLPLEDYVSNRSL